VEALEKPARYYHKQDMLTEMRPHTLYGRGTLLTVGIAAEIARRRTDPPEAEYEFVHQ